jgi:16S rRNA (uracil1498-N3)-methyltransferase
MKEVELYYSIDIDEEKKKLILDESESMHLTKVMRHNVGETIYVTDGKGKIFQAKISDIEDKRVICEVVYSKSYDNPLEGIVFCFPRLKNNDRFEFALEKSIELGITNFIVFESKRTVAKGDKLVRWRKIALSAMKQSLKAYMPDIEFIKSTDKLSEQTGDKIVVEQQGNKRLEEVDFIKVSKANEKLMVIFGPEGGLNDSEIEMLSGDESNIYKLHDSRLRSETAITYAASIISSQFRI